MSCWKNLSIWFSVKRRRRITRFWEYHDNTLQRWFCPKEMQSCSVFTAELSPYYNIPSSQSVFFTDTNFSILFSATRPNPSPPIDMAHKTTTTSNHSKKRLNARVSDCPSGILTTPSFKTYLMTIAGQYRAAIGLSTWQTCVSQKLTDSLWTHNASQTPGLSCCSRGRGEAISVVAEDNAMILMKGGHSWLARSWTILS